VTDTSAALVQNHRRFLAFLERRVDSRDEAEEILQAAYLKGVQEAGEVRGNAVAWFYRLLRNALIDHYRRRAAGRKALEARIPASFEKAIERTVCGCLNELLPTLRPEHGTILREVDLKGEALMQFAGRTGITPNLARVRLHRARQALRRQLRRVCRTCTEHGCLDCTCG